MTTSATGDALLEEQNLRITRKAVITPDEEYPLSDITAVERHLHKPFLIPVALGVFAAINAVVAVQTQFWGDYVACAVMLGGGMYWRHRGTRHVLRAERNGKTEAIWQTREAASLDRALACLEPLIRSRHLG